MIHWWLPGTAPCGALAGELFTGDPDAVSCPVCAEWVRLRRAAEREDSVRRVPPRLVGPLCEAGRFARCAHPSCESIVRDWCRGIVGWLLPDSGATLPQPRR